MTNGPRWKPEHRIALAVCVIAGGVAGFLLGFILRSTSVPTLGGWWTYYSGEALVWTFGGAVIVGAAVFAWRSFSN